MNLINKPESVQKVLRLLGPLAALMPRTIMNARYFRWTGKPINWKHPRNLQESILAEVFGQCATPQGLQLYAMLADKYAVRSYVEERAGVDALTALYGVWDLADEIDFASLPVPCVIKTNNGCGTNCIIRSRADIRPDELRKRLASWLRYPYGELSGQPHYSAIAPKIIAEEYLEQHPGSDALPYDYKFFCFNGQPKFILFYSGRQPNTHRTYNAVFDLEWNLIDGASLRPCPELPSRPEALDKMVSMARELSRGLRFVRVDFYGIGPRAVFGEMTMSPDVVINFTPEFLAQYSL